MNRNLILLIEGEEKKFKSFRDYSMTATVNLIYVIHLSSRSF